MLSDLLNLSKGLYQTLEATTSKNNFKTESFVKILGKLEQEEVAGEDQGSQELEHGQGYGNSGGGGVRVAPVQEKVITHVERPNQLGRVQGVAVKRKPAEPLQHRERLWEGGTSDRKQEELHNTEPNMTKILDRKGTIFFSKDQILKDRMGQRKWEYCQHHH